MGDLGGFFLTSRKIRLLRDAQSIHGLSGAFTPLMRKPRLIIILSVHLYFLSKLICTLPLLSILLSPRGHTQNTGLPGTFQTSASWFFPPFSELRAFPSESLFRSLRNCFSVVLMINHNGNHVKYLLYLYYDIYFILFCFQFSFARAPARRVNILNILYP